MVKSQWYLAILPLAAALGCAASAGNVTKTTVNLTGCTPANLAVFNYDKKAGTWDAACGERIFACGSDRGKKQCTPLQPDAVNPEMKYRVQLLQQIPSSRREYFALRNIQEGSWNDYARSVAVVGLVNDAQLKSIDDARTVYTGFSAAFDAQLSQCVGAQKVAEISVDASGALSPARGAASCVRALAMSPELSPLSKYPKTTFILVPGVRDLKLPPNPLEAAAAAKAAAVAAAEAKRLQEEQAKAKAAQDLAEKRPREVQAWLDASHAALRTCTGLKEIPVDVAIDEMGMATVSLPGKLNTKYKSRCVQDALGQKQFDGGGAGTLSFVVGAPKPIAVDEAGAPSTPATTAPAAATPAAPAAAAPAAAAPAAATPAAATPAAAAPAAGGSTSK